jgi:predicted AAA+ superfamily ATPase
MPPGYALRLWQLHRQSEEESILTIPSSFAPNPAAQVCPALQNFIPADLEFKSLVLIGPSGCGKTTLSTSQIHLVDRYFLEQNVKVHMNQNGFRRRKGCIDHALALDQAIADNA